MPRNFVARGKPAILFSTGEDDMKNWSASFKDGLISGSLASVLSTAVLALRGRSEAGSAYAPVNAVSHWLYGDRAARQDKPSARYTLPGYIIHHGSSLIWGVVYERWFGQCAEEKDLPPALAGAVAVASLACFVDYKLTPERLQPGFEKRLSTPSMALVYGGVAIGFVIRGLLSSGRTAH
jgi:hypothetical protein